MARFRVVQLLLAFVIVGSLCSLAFADPCPTITVDENGNGTLDFTTGGGCGAAAIPIKGVLAPDPGPGGLPAVLTYNLLGPPSLVAGDVLLTDADLGGAVLDVVRFNPAGTGGNPAYQASLVFYSDNAGGFDALGDTPLAHREPSMRILLGSRRSGRKLIMGRLTHLHRVSLASLLALTSVTISSAMLLCRNRIRLPYWAEPCSSWEVL